MTQEKKYILTDADGNPIEFNDPIVDDFGYDIHDPGTVMEIDGETYIPAEAVEGETEAEAWMAQALKELTLKDKIVCLGDDMTYGYGVKANECWVGLLNAKHGMNLLNRGMQGDPTVNLVYRFDKHVLPEHPKAVIITGGGNDLIGEIPMEYITKNLEDLCEKALTNRILPIMTIAPEPCHENVPAEWVQYVNYDRVKENYAYLREWILLLCKANGVPLIDFDLEMKNSLRGRYGTYFFNGVHPDHNGHRLMARIAWDFFVKAGIEGAEDKFAL